VCIERQIEEMAKLDRIPSRSWPDDRYPISLKAIRWYEPDGAIRRYDITQHLSGSVSVEGPVFCSSCPDYLDDHNAIQNIIDAMNDTDGANYVRILSDMVGYSHEWSTENVVSLVKASCAQKVEAVLKTYERWEDSES